MVYIPVYSVYAIYRRDQVSVVDSVYMVYIPVYSVYAIYRRSTSQCDGQCVYGVYT